MPSDSPKPERPPQIAARKTTRKKRAVKRVKRRK